MYSLLIKHCSSSSQRSCKILDDMDRALTRITTLNVRLLFFLFFISTNVMASLHVVSKIGTDNPASIREHSNTDIISIDCGANEDYMEDGIWYQTDRDFVDTGTNQVVSPAVNLSFSNNSGFERRVHTLRSFSDGVRNCYTLKPKEGKNNSYLIRAFFLYGNYDGKNQTPTFDLYLGVNYWDTVASHGTNVYEFKEIIHTPSTDTIDVCLVKTGHSIPFISSLKLRLLMDRSIYQIKSTLPFLLNLQARIDVGARYLRFPGRYKDDIYDRLWVPYARDDWFPFYKSVDIDSTQDAYRLPLEVWRTAVQPFNVSYDLVFDYNYEFYPSLNKSSTYYIYFHFAEITKLPPGKKRIVSISLNGENILSEPLTLEYLKPVTVSHKSATQGYIHFSINATSESDAPPMLNAFEIHKLGTKLSSPTYTTDVDAIMNVKSTYKILKWQGDPCVPKQYAWEGLICNSDIIPRIISLNLSSSGLNGDITPAISNLSLIEYLDLSNNSLTGNIPGFLSQLRFLRVLNLQGNQLSGAIPTELTQRSKDGSLVFDYGGNPSLCSPNSCNKISKNKAVTPLVASLIGAFIFTTAITFWMYKRRRPVTKAVSKLSHFSNFNKRLQSKDQRFTFAEVLRITNNFERVVGKGGFGVVYHGYLGSTQVAVKVLFPSAQGYLQFQGEAKLLTMIHHKRLIALIGYCDEGTNLALIYEYMANGALAEHLSDKSEHIIGWKQRLQIAIHAAEGLEYLHNGCKPPIVHRDVKSRNILLNEKFHGKLADFGLSKIFADEDDTHVYTTIAGTPGYLDPEYYISNRLTEKSDVYSFGVVLLEIITGQPAISKTIERIPIVKWVESMLPSGDIDNIVDSRLQEEYDINSARKALDIAMACVALVSTNRPTMSLVVRELKECLPMETALPSNLHLGPSCSSIDISFDRISGESSLAR